jgi:NADP-dependent 3-hydroxy acid dehydrogenase YdfG
MSLDGKVALVTGASAGIGAAVVDVFAEAGATVVGGARRVDEVRAEVSLFLDVTDPASCAAFVAAAVERFGGFDILVNNAGIGIGRHAAWDEDAESTARIVETNLGGSMRLARAAVPHVRPDGHLIFIGSVASRHAHAGAATYIASKHGLRGFVRALRHDLLGQPVRVTSVDPGLVESDFWTHRFGGDTERSAAVFENVRALSPRDVAECVLFAATRPAHVDVEELIVMPTAHTETRVS